MKRRDKVKNEILEILKNKVNNMNDGELYDFKDYIFRHHLSRNFKLFKDKQHTRNVKQMNISNVVSVIYNEWCERYYYNSTSDIIFRYDADKHFKIVSQDDVINSILRIISTKCKNISTTNKSVITRRVLMKIKSNSIYDVVPESSTIQMVIGLLTPIIFPHKLYSKLFLFVLGSIITKTCSLCIDDLFFLHKCDDNLQSFLKSLNTYLKMNFHNMTIFNTFKTRYYGHDMSKSRLLKVNSSTPYTMNILNQPSMMLNIICVSIHYSERYTNIDKFLENICQNNKHDDEFRCAFEYINSLRTTSPKTLMIDFFDTMCVKKNDVSINEEELVFIWKRFLNKRNLPSYLLFKNEFISKFNEYCIENSIKIEKNDKGSRYLNIFSYDVPKVRIFTEFWRQNLIPDENEKFLELEEICTIFNRAQRNSEKELSIVNIKPIIQHFYPDIQIYSGKYIHKKALKCWNKRGDVQKFLTHITENAKTQGMIHNTSNKDKVYVQYCKYMYNDKNGQSKNSDNKDENIMHIETNNNGKQKINVSKTYFKFVMKTMTL